MITSKRLPTEAELERFRADDDDDDARYYIDPDQLQGQSYEDHAVFGVQCAKCGNRTFYVGYHAYLTVCRCAKCKAIVHVHDG